MIFSEGRILLSQSPKSALVFFVGVIVAQVSTYYIAGLIAFLGLGSAQYYPPSPNAISFLREVPPLSVTLPGQILRALLFGLVLYPFRARILELGRVWGGLSASAVIFIAGYVAASGGIIERAVYYTPLPLGFVLITVTEILIQTLLFGQVLLYWMKKFR
jgi:hypothetical protein